MGHGAHEPYYAGSTGYHHGRTASSASTASITSSTSHNHHGRKHHNAVGTTTPRRESSSTLTAAGLASPGSPLGPRLQPAAGGGGGGGAPTLRPSSSVPRFGWLQQHHQQHQYPGAAAAEDGRPRVRSMQPALGGTEPVGNDDGGGVQNSNARPQKSAAATVPGHEPTQHALGRDESLRDETDSGPRAETHTQPHEGLRAGVKWWNDPWMPTSKHPHQHNHSRPDNLPHNTDAQHHHQSPHNLPQHHHQPLQQQHQQQLGQPTGGMYRSSTGGSPRREMESDPKLNGVSVRPLPSPAPSSPGLPGSVGYQSGDDPTGLSTSSAHFRGGNPSTHVSTHATWCRSAVDYPPVTTMTPPPPTGALAQIRPEARPPEDRRASSSASLWSISATSAGVVVGARGPGQPEGLIGNDRNPNHHYHHQYSVHEHSPRPDAEDGWNSSRPGSFTDRRPPPVSPATLPSHPVLATGSVSGNTRQIKGFATITPNNISSLCNSPTTITYEAALPPRAPSTGASWKRLPSFVGFPASTSPSPSSPAHQPRPPPPPQPMDQDPSTSPGTSATEYNLVESSLPPMMSRASLASSTGSASDSTSSTVTTTSTDTTITTNPIHQRKARAGSLIGAGSSTPGENGGKKEYRCTKKEGCNMLFSCNSLRKPSYESFTVIKVLFLLSRVN
ncbi:hypothetical protein DFH27DRAFT_522892 [Peziza echinospora]|nr:hypothetical protein DFH27DRAFT_522892 [Peziza echinospora]